jgi:hypothetical protein
MFVGSSVGNLLPELWGGDAFSLTGMMLALVGGIVGIWVGYRLGKAVG